MTRPLIGITTWRRRFDTELGVGRSIHTLGEEYAAPFERAGASVALLPPTAGIDEVLVRLDGVVLSGGEDVHPGRYGSEPQHDKEYDPDRDAFEIELVRGAIGRRMPVLAICRGMQVLNVALGGTLVVDIPATAEHRPSLTGRAQLAERHPITLAPDSRLAEVYGATERVVNTIHHQAVDVPAPGFRPVAWTADGIVEAIEAVDDIPLWAVQWHPEKMLDPAEAGEEKTLFAAFVAAAQRKAAETGLAEKGTR